MNSADGRRAKSLQIRAKVVTPAVSRAVPCEGQSPLGGNSRCFGRKFPREDVSYCMRPRTVSGMKVIASRAALLALLASLPLVGSEGGRCAFGRVREGLL